MRRILPILMFAAACEAPMTEDDFQKNDDVEKADSSNQATVLNFEFDSELVTDSSWNTNQTIQDQLLYTIGHLNGNRAVGRLDKLTLTNVQEADVDGKTRIRYHAKMPVAWGSKTNLPTSYAFKLPHDVSYAALESFTTKYKEDCVDFGAHDVDSGSMWYYYRPNNSGCKIADAELYKFTAKVSVSPTNTTGKYPEYHKIWEDNQLRIVAIFGKYEEGGQAGDAGVDAFNAFVSRVKTALGRYSLTTVPASIPTSPGPSLQDVTFNATLADGKKVVVNAMLVDSITNPGSWFDPRYSSLTATADVIAYNGHAGLGQNVRAIARKGKWAAGQYLMMFMNGCDTFAYVDGYMAQTRAAINSDDPTGTKYMDIVVNAMPAFFASDAGASMALINGLLSYDSPKTYEEMFRNIDNSQVVLVSGEEDNVYYPGFGTTTPPTPPAGTFSLDKSGSVTKSQEARFQTDSLAPGTYVFTMTGTGDADLYVKTGAPPSTTSYQCRPYSSSSNETCTVKLNAAGAIHVMVRGYAASSTYHLVGAKN